MPSSSHPTSEKKLAKIQRPQFGKRWQPEQGGEKKKKVERKNMILSFIISRGKITTTDLLSLVLNEEKMNRTTLCDLLKELQSEGLIQKVGWQWQTEIGIINDLPN